VSASPTAAAEGKRPPLVAFFTTAPMLARALSEVFERIAEVQRFPAGRGDSAGLLRWLGPEALLVDDSQKAGETVVFARDSGCPLIEVDVAGQTMRTLGADGWSDQTATEASPEAIRDIIVESIFRGRGVLGASLVNPDGSRNVPQGEARLRAAAGVGSEGEVSPLRAPGGEGWEQ
jgi:hypothetical protein